MAKRDEAAEAARDANTAEAQAPSTPEDPGAIGTPNVVIERARPGADLLPLEIGEGKAQSLSAGEKARLTSDADLAEARRNADAEYVRATADIRARHREAVGAQIDEQRDAARKELGAQREAIRANNPQIGGVMVLNPAALELEGALIRAEAEALNLDETVPGGVYIVAGQLVDAHGTVLGQAD
jgi:hypothetical protein